MNKGNTNVIMVFATLLIVVAGLFALQWSATHKNLNLSNDSGVPCLLPNLPLTVHTHQQLTITIDSKEQPIPGDIGITPTCEHALHTHDATGEIHVESQMQRDYTLGDFMNLWGKPIERTGYALTMTVDGLPSQEFGKLILKDNQRIKLIYTKVIPRPNTL